MYKCKSCEYMNRKKLEIKKHCKSDHKREATTEELSKIPDYLIIKKEFEEYMEKNKQENERIRKIISEPDIKKRFLFIIQEILQSEGLDMREDGNEEEMCEVLSRRFSSIVENTVPEKREQMIDHLQGLWKMFE